MDPGCVLQQNRFVALSNAAAASADAGDDIDVALRALAFDACARWLLLGPRMWAPWSQTALAQSLFDGTRQSVA
jgi:hypothetical protein